MSDSTTPPESSAGEMTLAARDSARVEAPPQRVGRYQILDVLGEGGMGVVYRAEQTHPVRRHVALKLIKLGLDTRQIVARFEGERQALALMDHPGIARVYDAGADDLGRPFFAMEYVPGEPITRYCDARRCSIRRRLELFCQACAAVQHAHQKGIIHRDLKPGNMLVHEIDGQPVVKVIDFGLAKAMNEPLSNRPLGTETGQLLGTPEYLSPEQARGQSGVDTRSDVYSLGVILYELLTGSLPFDPSTLRSGSYADIERVICTVDPPLPSTRIGSDPSRAPSLRALKSDLDWVVMKAIEKDPENRYAGASELSAEIQRFLSDEPVLAGPPTATYRLRKFVRRNRIAVGVSAAILFCVVAGLVGTTLQMVRARRAEHQTVQSLQRESQQRHAAELNAVTVEAVNEFLTRTLESVNPEQALGKEVTVRQMLDAAAAKLGTGLTEQPAVEAKLRLTIGKTYKALGRADDAMPHLQRALELAQQGQSQDDKLALLALDLMGMILSDRGRFVEAETLLRQQLELAQRKLGADHPSALYAMNTLAVCLQGQGRLSDAEKIYRQVIAGMRRSLGPEHRDVLIIESNLAFLVAQLGRMEEAGQMLQASLAAQQKALGANHPRTLTTQNNLALVLERLDRGQEAIALYRENLQQQVQVNGPDHPGAYLAMANLGNALRRAGENAEAEPLLRQALEGELQHFGPAAGETQETAHGLSLVLLASGQAEQALELARSSYLSLRDAPRLTLTGVHARHRYAWMLVKLGRFAEAEPVARDALERAEQLLKPGAPLREQARATLADCLERLGRADEATAVRATTVPAQ
jgi:non-specific serine/threonine protein kinase/serine/threonine-protein kinase